MNNGHYPSLYKNDVFIPIVGNIGNIGNINKNNNIVCGSSNKNTVVSSTTDIISGISNLDGNMYLLSTTDIKNSSPINIVTVEDGGGGGTGGGIGGGEDSGSNIQKQKQIQIQIVTYNKYGQTHESYDLIYNPTNIENTSIYKVNTISFDKHDMRLYPSNTLSFIPEIIMYSKDYLKNKYVKDII